MSNAIEIEAKALVSQDDYRKLAKLFPDSPRYTQTNHYIDSDERILFKEGIALRIREKNGQYELTLKTPLSQGLLEKNCVITKQQFDDFKEKGIFPKGDTSRFLTMLDIDIATLKILTSLTGTATPARPTTRSSSSTTTSAAPRRSSPTSSRKMGSPIPSPKPPRPAGPWKPSRQSKQGKNKRALIGLFFVYRETDQRVTEGMASTSGSS